MRSLLIGAVSAVLLIGPAALAQRGGGGAAGGGASPAAEGGGGKSADGKGDSKAPGLKSVSPDALINGGGSADGDEGGGTEGSEVSPVPVLDSSRAVAPGQTHTVEKGDTLWDLSQKVLGSPWYWPKVWSYNPSIANPHWIYPGNTVNFFPGGDESPAEVAVGGGSTGGSSDRDDETGPVSTESDGVKVAGKIGYQQKAGFMWRTLGFVTAAEVEASGSIFGSWGETNMMTFPQQPYLKFKSLGDVRVGQQYVVFRAGEEIHHPFTRNRVGYFTAILGIVKIVKIHEKEKVARADIVRSFDEIHRGDLLGPMNEELTRRVSARPNERDVEGIIVSSVPTGMSVFGEHHVLVVDRGSEHGVRPGNMFSMIRRQDGTMQGVLVDPLLVDEAMPEEEVGQCMAIDVKSTATICLVTRSLREMVVGEKVRMRTASAGGAEPRASRD